MGKRPLSDQVAEEVRALCARRRITGRELARRLGRSHSWVNYRLTGRQEIGLNDLELFATALGVDAAALIPRQSAGETTVRTFQSSERPRGNRPQGRPKTGSDIAGVRRPRRIAAPTLATALPLAA